MQRPLSLNTGTAPPYRWRMRFLLSRLFLSIVAAIVTVVLVARALTHEQAHESGAIGTTGASDVLDADDTTGIDLPDIILFAADAPVRKGAWVIVADSTAAGGRRLSHPDAGAPKLNAPLAAPTHYFELTFAAESGIPYRLWFRGQAEDNDLSNDSAYVQFSDSVTSSGAPAYRIGTETAMAFTVEDCNRCGVSGWGWQDNGYGEGVLGPEIFFESGGTHTIRVQTREDGLSIDQIVLSPFTYLDRAPGATKDDRTILKR